jgi:hypothetical protein
MVFWKIDGASPLPWPNASERMLPAVGDMLVIAGERYAVVLREWTVTHVILHVTHWED